MAKSNKERKDKYFDGQIALGRITRGVSATPDEHEEIKACLASSRYDGLEWIECDVSGHLRAIGIKGEYWIMQEAWTYLELVSSLTAGPNITKLGGAFDSVEEAQAFAELEDAKP